jgi:tryptophan-rich sensory protein
MGLSNKQRGCYLGLAIGDALGAAFDNSAVGPNISDMTITKPSWNPPDYVFGPVWSTLFFMMGIAAWLVWEQVEFRCAKLPLGLFGVQLLLNVSWSWIFFGLHQPGWAFVEIVILWLAILVTTVVFFRRSKVAGSLMMPYLVWVSFASVLYFAIWQLNG